VFQDRSQGSAVYGRDRALSLFNNCRYQIYFRQDDLETAQYLETRCGSKSGFAHSKTEHEGGVSTGESEQKMPLISAQYIMYDMPDEEILGFWGKRPFLAKRIPRLTKPPESKTSEDPVTPLFPAISSFVKPAQAELPSSWRMDPTLLRHWQSQQATDGINKLA
jgi:type IV secretory pathway TraG/TraD family ATPase VirD4